MTEEELITVITALRTGEFQIILQDFSNPQKDKILIFNGNSAIYNNEEKPIIYLVEK